MPLGRNTRGQVAGWTPFTDALKITEKIEKSKLRYCVLCWKSRNISQQKLPIVFYIINNKLSSIFTTPMIVSFKGMESSRESFKLKRTITLVNGVGIIVGKYIQ